MEIPIGFEMTADAFGLNVSYETQATEKDQMNTSGASMRSKSVKE